MSVNELAVFTNSVNNLIESKLILVDKNIAMVLKCVASSDTLCKVLSNAIRTTPYATEFSRAKVTWTTGDGRVVSQLKLPVDRNRLFAFVVCLLTEVDSGRRNLLDFLKEFYDSTDTNRGYEKFANEVLKPFKQAGIGLLSNVDPESLSTEKVARAERFFSAEKIYVPTNLINQILTKLEQVNVQVRTLQFPKEVVEQTTYICEYLANALYLKNPKILWIVLVAFQNALQPYEQLQKLTVEISNAVMSLLK